MLNRIGYACINIHLKPKTFRTCRIKSIYTKGISYLKDIIINNLLLTKEILEWNIENKIFMYRATSQLFPLVTHPDILNDFDWRWQKDEDVLIILDKIKNIVVENGIRLSMHPDQFTVLNSPNEKVVKNSIENLKYHYEILKRMGGRDIIIHTGGVYGDKRASIERFIETFNNLDEEIKAMIRLENDDVSYDIEDVLTISKKTGVPIVLDIHHHRCNNENKVNIKDRIIEIKRTWDNSGLIPKFHISSGKENPTDKKHHDYVNKQDFKYLLEILKDIKFDLMVEAKMKEKAVLELLSLLHVY